MKREQTALNSLRMNDNYPIINMIIFATNGTHNTYKKRKSHHEASAERQFRSTGRV